MNNFKTIVISLGITAMWFSLWLSTQTLTVDNSTVERYMKQAYNEQGASTGNVEPVPLSGRGGFPLPAFKYPVSPLGGDVPNADAFFPFLLNIGFWLAVLTAVLWFVPKRYLTTFVMRVAVGLACVMTIFGIGFLLLKFD